MSENDNNRSIMRELQEVKSLVQQVTGSLESQRAILQQRGMNLPPMVLNTLRTVGNQLGTMDDALIEDQTELGQLRALADVSAQITTSLDVDTVLEEAMDIVIALTRAERGYIILVDDETGELEFRVSRDETIGGQSAGVPQISRGVLRHVMVNKEPLLADNAFEDERLQGNVSIANFSLRSVLCVPLMYKDDIIGVVYVDNRLQAGIFTEREKKLLTAFANTAAVAITNALLYADIQRLLTEITQVKDLMDNVFASIGSGVIATDADNLVQTFNRAAEKILNREPQETVGKKIEYVLPNISADFSDYLAQIREEGENQTIDGEFNIRDRGRVAVSMKLTPLRDASEQTQGVAVVLDDVTRQIEQKQQLLVMKNYLPPEMVDNIHTISQLALGGERRHVTCIFVEVRPFSTLKDVPPGEIMDILNVYLDIATHAIHQTRGIVDKYMGNEVMALYNTQLSPDENHALLAIEAALQMRDSFVELYQRTGINPDPHYYRLGMHTGECTLGNVGSLTRRDFTAIGDTINLSKRLQENAASGQIIISQETRDYLEACAGGNALPCRFEELPAIQVKGRQQKTRIYEVFRA